MAGVPSEETSVGGDVFAAPGTGVDETGDDAAGYLDLDYVELMDDDFQTISNIRKLSDTMQDKLVFTIFAMDIMLTGFMAGFSPQHYYLFYTAKAALLLSYRWYSYKKIKYHYFLLDFCYFTNFLVLVYLWFPFFEKARGMLFPIIFAFSNGPLIAAVVLWRNSIVPHSTDKMTSMFIHISPAVTLWGLRWYSTSEQGFPLCANPTAPGAGGCDHVNIWEIELYPMFMYLLWQIGYVAVVFFWQKERIQKQEYVTSYGYIIERTRNGFLYNLSGVLGPRYRKLVFMVWQFIYTVVSMLFSYPCYHNRYVNLILGGLVLTLASYNGASFYIDVFSLRYRANSTATKQKTT